MQEAKKCFEGRKTKAGSGGGLTVRACLRRREGDFFFFPSLLVVSPKFQGLPYPGGPTVAPRAEFGVAQSYVKSHSAVFKKAKPSLALI